MIDASRLRSALSAPSEEQVLIDGSYKTREARDLALALIDAAINEHRLRNLQSEIRTQTPNDDATDAVEGLRQLRGQLREIFSQARGHKSPVRLKATIQIEFDETPPRR